MINLTVNGKPRPIEASVDLESYLSSFGFNLKFVAVGYNGEVIKKDQLRSFRHNVFTFPLLYCHFFKEYWFFSINGG